MMQQDLHSYFDFIILSIAYAYNLCTFSCRWNFTGHMSSLCGYLYENGSALTFITVLDRRVITKVVDTTYATHVSFYLLFGE